MKDNNLLYQNPSFFVQSLKVKNIRSKKHNKVKRKKHQKKET